MYANGRVLRYVYMYICLHICAHKWYSACYMSANGKGLNYIPHQTSSLWTSKAAGHGGLAAAVVA